MVEQAKFPFCPLGEALDKQTKAIKCLREKQIKAIKDNKRQLFNTNAHYY